MEDKVSQGRSPRNKVAKVFLPSKPQVIYHSRFLTVTVWQKRRVVHSSSNLINEFNFQPPPGYFSRKYYSTLNDISNTCANCRFIKYLISEGISRLRNPSSPFKNSYPSNHFPRPFIVYWLLGYKNIFTLHFSLIT